MYSNMYPKYVQCNVYSKHKSGIEKEIIVLSFRVMKYFMEDWYLNHILLVNMNFPVRQMKGGNVQK